MKETASTPTIPETADLDRVFLDFVDRWYAGERPSVEELLRRHPAHSTSLSLLLQSWRPALEGPFPVTWIPREFGGYRLLCPIGEGGSGTVYLAEQKALRRLVALKLLAPAGPEAAARFRREAEILGCLEDRRIVAVHEYGEEKGLRFLAMEFVAGVSLAALLRRAKARLAAKPDGERSVEALDVRQLLPEFPLAKNPKPVPYVPFVVGFLAEVLEALGNVHLQGILHRDLKPANLLLSRAGLPRIIDFGLARESEDVPSSSGRAGTPLYRSPERISDPKGPSDPRSDLFALGVVLYEALTLQHPFEGASEKEVCDRILACRPQALRRVDPRLPRDLEAVVARAIEGSPRRRYPTAEEFASELWRFLRREPVEAHPLGTLGRGARWVEKEPRAAALGLFAVLLATLTASVLAVQAGRSDAELQGRYEARELQRFGKILQTEEPIPAEQAGKSLTEGLKKFVEEARKAKK